MTLKRAAFLETSDNATTPIQMYGWNGEAPVRIKCASDGSPLNGFPIPEFDQIVSDESDPDITVFTYKKSGVTVATVSQVIEGTTTTWTFTLA